MIFQCRNSGGALRSWVQPIGPGKTSDRSTMWLGRDLGTWPHGGAAPTLLPAVPRERGVYSTVEVNMRPRTVDLDPQDSPREEGRPTSVMRLPTAIPWVWDGRGYQGILYPGIMPTALSTVWHQNVQPQGRDLHQPHQVANTADPFTPSCSGPMHWPALYTAPPLAIITQKQPQGKSCMLWKRLLGVKAMLPSLTGQ